MRVLTISREQCLGTKERLAGVFGYTVVHIVLRGRGYYNGQPLCAGQGFIIFENSFGEYYPDENEPWEYIYIRISGDDALAGLGDVFSWNTAFEQELRNIAADKSHSSNAMYEAGRAYMLFSYISGSEKPLTQEQKHIRDAENYILAYYREISSARAVADKLGLSRAYLRNLFVAEKGIPTKEYIIRVRLEHACEMLASDFPIKLIAYSVGYADQLRFSKSFKKRMGVSPTEYRRQARLARSQSLGKEITPQPKDMI